MNEPLVSIVIPTYNKKEKIMHLIDSITKSDYPKNKLEIIVVDDASNDGTCDLIKKSFPNVTIIRNNGEKLLAQSRNIGIQLSHAGYIFLIDDDNVIDPNTIKIMVHYLKQNPEVGVVGPIMYFLRDPKRIWCAGVKRSYWTTITKLIGCNTVDNGQISVPLESEDFPNAFMVRSEVFKKVGLFDSKLFPIHYDEGDFFRKVRRAGYKIIMMPSAKVWHDIQLPKQGKSEMLHLKSPLRTYYSIRNRLIFHRKWSSTLFQKISAAIFSLGVLFYYVYVILLGKSSGKMEKVEKLLKGYADGLKVPMNRGIK